LYAWHHRQRLFGHSRRGLIMKSFLGLRQSLLMF
jgi:hypothetical protein